MLSVNRYHDISCGHRVVGHESKCRHLHGHNYRVHFTVQGELDSIGRVLDFSVVKSRLCMWLEDQWDHKFLAWESDMEMKDLQKHSLGDDWLLLSTSVVWVPFNPTAENMANYLLHVIGPSQLEGTGCKLTKVLIEETRKCSAEVSLDEG